MPLVIRSNVLTFIRIFLTRGVALGAGILLLSFVGADHSFAQIPRILHYQAALAEDDRPVEGPIDVEVAFYRNSTGGTALADWQESYPDVSLIAGRFHLLLGSQRPLPDALLKESTLHLELTINGEVLPRVPLVSTAFALRSARAETVVDGGVTAVALADGAVTESALAEAAVTANALAPEGVTTRTLADGAVTGAKLAERAVTTGHLADGAVTSNKIGPKAVAASSLADGAVTTSKLANGSVTEAKVASGQFVTSLNDLTDAVRLVGGSNVTIWPNADAGTVTISAEQGQSSSRRWKTDIHPLDEGLALVQQLQGVRYRWAEDGTADLGLIAEDVGRIVPEVVTYARNGVDAETVNYARLVAVLVEAIKTQQRQLEADRALLHRLHTRLDSLERAQAVPE